MARPPALPIIRRVVTGHDPAGQAVFRSDAPAANVVQRAASGVVSTLLWVTDAAPADAHPATDPAERSIGTAPPPRGTILRIVDFPPVSDADLATSHAEVLREMGIAPGAPGAGHGNHANPFMHRTASIDYAIVLQGEIDMLVDADSVHLRAGDVLVQCATNHAWVNRGPEWCRIAFTLIDAG